MDKYDIIYQACKWFFSLYWFVYITSLVKGWDSGIMFHITGVISIIYLIVNIKWYLRGT